MHSSVAFVWSSFVTHRVYPASTRSVWNVYNALWTTTIAHCLKCPMCRAKHELGEKGPELLPVNQYAARELLSQRQQQQGEASRMRGCHSCGEELELVAWCEDCNGDICQTCLSQHKKMSALQQHRLIVDPEEIRSSTSMKKSVPVPSTLVWNSSMCALHVWRWFAQSVSC